MVLGMFLATLAAPGIQWDSGNSELNDRLAKLAEFVGPAGMAAAADFESESSLDPFDHIEVMTSAEYGENIRHADAWEDNDDDEDDWCAGDFFMINITRRFSYFSVCWGSEDNPGPVSIAALEVQYLGGVTLEDFPVEGISVPGVPLPIATVFATSMVHMIEFEDTGLAGQENTTAGNGVFDFTRSGEGLSDFDLESAEDVHAGVDLNLNWDMTEDGIEEWSDGNQAGWNFTIEARNVSYDGANMWWLTANDDVVERIAYTFHLGVTIEEVTEEVIPWWTVTLVENESADLGYSISDISDQQNLTWSGVRVGTDFKYDQWIDGWDFHNTDSLLLVESVIVRGSFTLSAISDFMDEVAGEVGAFDEQMAYDSDEEDEVVLGTGDVTGVNKVSGTNVEWRNHFRKVPDKLHWVDTAEAGESPDDMHEVNVTFQLHASEAISVREEGASVALYIALGGVIYPAAKHIFHDPGYSASINLVQLGAALLSNEIVGLQFVTVALLGILGIIAVVVRKRKHRKALELQPLITSGIATAPLLNTPALTVAALHVSESIQPDTAIQPTPVIDVGFGQPPGGFGPGPGQM
jgi:hypothetical protein